MYVHIYYIYFKLNHVAIHLKLKQHCKLIIFQLKKKRISPFKFMVFMLLLLLLSRFGRVRLCVTP